MKIKILHVLHSLQVGGLENGVVNLINRLDLGRFEHAICCVSTSGPMAERLTNPVRIVELGKGAGRDYLLPLKLARVIRDIAPDIVHTRNWGTIDGVVAARLAGINRIIHGEHGREATDPGGANARRKRARKLLAPLVSRFVTVSDDLQRWLVSDVGIPGHKVQRIINGVDTVRFNPAEDRRRVREALGVGSDLFVVGTVGRLDPVKDQQTLLRAFAAMDVPLAGRGSNPPCELFVVGSGPEEKALRTVAGELGIAYRVRFLGERADIPDLMRAMDIFVLPSIAEGISNTILEAMASGLPVVASRIGGNPELVDDMKCGALFTPGDSRQIAHLLSSYYRDSGMRVSHGFRGRERVEEMFSLARMVYEYGELYTTVYRRVR